MYTVLDYNRGRYYLRRPCCSCSAARAWDTPATVGHRLFQDMMPLLDSDTTPFRYSPTDYGSAIMTRSKPIHGRLRALEQPGSRCSNELNMLLALGAGKIARAGRYRTTPWRTSSCAKTPITTQKLEGYRNNQSATALPIFLAIAGIYLAFKIYKTVKRFRNFMRRRQNCDHGRDFKTG